jgi:hypothetical protein
VVSSKRATLVRVLLCTLIVLSLVCAGPAHAALHADHAMGSDCSACLFASLEAPPAYVLPPLLQQAELSPQLRSAKAPLGLPHRLPNARGPPHL